MLRYLAGVWRILEIKKKLAHHIVLCVVLFLLQSSLSTCYQQIRHYQEALMFVKLIALEIQNTVNVGIVKVDDDTKQLCRQLFGSMMITYSTITGAYLDTINQKTRCGYQSDFNFVNELIFFQGDAESAAKNVTYFLVGRDLNVMNPHNQSFPYNPRYESWYDKNLYYDKMRWSEPYIHPLSKKATITLTAPVHTYNTIEARNEYAGMIALDIRLDEITRYFIHNNRKEEFIVEKGSKILISFPSSHSNHSTKRGGDSQVLIPAVSSDNRLIAKATKSMIKLGWPSWESILVHGILIKPTLYVDDVEGLEWYVIDASGEGDYIDEVKAGSDFFAIIIAISVFTILFSGFCVYLLYYHRHSRTLQLLQPKIIPVILMGAFLLPCYCLSLLGSSSRLSCTVRPYLLIVSGTMYVGPMCARAWYVYFKFRQIMVLQQTNAGPRGSDNLTTYKFILVGVFIAVGIIVTTCVMFIGFDGSEPVTSIIMINGVHTEITHCAYLTNRSLLIIQGSYILSIFVFGFTFSYLIRHFPDAVSGGRVLLAVILISCVVMVLTVVTVDSIDNIEHYILAQTVGISVAVLIGLSLLFFPPYYKMITMGDHVASKDYIDNFLATVAASHKDGRSNKGKVLPVDITPRKDEKSKKRGSGPKLVIPLSAVLEGEERSDMAEEQLAQIGIVEENERNHYSSLLKSESYAIEDWNLSTYRGDASPRLGSFRHKAGVDTVHNSFRLGRENSVRRNRRSVDMIMPQEGITPIAEVDEKSAILNDDSQRILLPSYSSGECKV